MKEWSYHNMNILKSLLVGGTVLEWPVSAASFDLVDEVPLTGVWTSLGYPSSDVPPFELGHTFSRTSISVGNLSAAL